MSQRNFRNVSTAEIKKSMRQGKRPAKPRVDRTRNANFGLRLGNLREYNITHVGIGLTFTCVSYSEQRNIRKVLRRDLPAYVIAKRTYNIDNTAENLERKMTLYTVLLDRFERITPMNRAILVPHIAFECGVSLEANS
jgi:hypothetical protein